MEKKFGGGKIDPAKQRGVNEKITDSARVCTVLYTVRMWQLLMNRRACLRRQLGMT